MDSLLGAVILTTSALYLYSVLYLYLRRTQLRGSSHWLYLTLVAALISGVTFFIDPAAPPMAEIGRGFLLGLTLIITLLAYGQVIYADLQTIPNRKPNWPWLALSALWLLAFIAVGLMNRPLPIAQPDWIVQSLTTPTLSTWLLLVGLVLAALILIGSSLRAFYTAPLPETANRALFWVVNAAVVFLGILLLISGSQTLTLLGCITLLVGCAGALYASLWHKVFDIRSSFNLAIRLVVLLFLTAAAFFIALYVSTRLTIPQGIEHDLMLALIALAVALIYIPLRKGIELIINPLFKSTAPDAAVVTRAYSQKISDAVDVDSLVIAVSDTLNSTLKVRRSAILLVYDTAPQAVEVVAPQQHAHRGSLTKDGLIYRQLAAQQQPITQFDIQYSPLYKSVLPAERDFLRDLQMSAYAPIIVENQLIGILASGPKLNDTPYFEHDLELLATLANQTGVALRNARLVADLKRLNADMAKLNNGLESANLQMGKLDAVKTDFVTIASHELRTPLAQLRGYTDIMGALNDQGMLDQQQTASMVHNLSKAAERMEELIAAMLDVSQLDVNAMDMRFSPTTAESVVRMAIEPLTEAIRQRKLSLSVRGMRALPPLEADLQRLVQAFRNLIVNAIKFTPDGGKIDITGRTDSSIENGATDSLLIIITDTGVGISAENRELIFQKFYRGYDPTLHSTGAYKFMGAGPGLGLTIARGVIEGHGGKIWAESPGFNQETFPGSTFYIRLPLKPADTSRRVMAIDEKTAPSSSAAQS